MALVVSALGVLIGVIGLIGLIVPMRLMGPISRWHGPPRFAVAVLLRLAIGVVLLVAAPDCRLPVVVRVLGFVTIVAAVGLLFVGRRRLDAFIDWWLGQRVVWVRVGCVFALVMGGLLVYCGV